MFRTLEATGLGLVVLNAALYFAAYRPLEKRIASGQLRYSELRQAVHVQQVRVARLEKYRAELPQAGEQLMDFTSQHTPSRKRGFSTAAHLLRQLADASGVQPPGIVYRLGASNHDPLERLGLDISVGGPYPGLLKFAHSLETADNLILVREFSFAPGENGALGLHIVADLYLTP